MAVVRILHFRQEYRRRSPRRLCSPGDTKPLSLKEARQVIDAGIADDVTGTPWPEPAKAKAKGKGKAKAAAKRGGKRTARK